MMHRFLPAWAAAFVFSVTAVTSNASAQDAAAGQKVFLLCRACHQIGPGAKNLIGPELDGVIGRKAGSVKDFEYSDAMKNSGITWDEATFTAFIKDPQGKVPDTKMTFPGIKDEARIKNLIAYLKQYDASGNKK